MSHNGKLHSLSNFDFRSRIVELRKDKKLCDITIQLSDNSQLTAHKAIVYTFCKTAEVLCSDNTIVIPMPDISIEVLQHVLSFIYGEMIIVEDNYIGAVDILAHYLGVDDLIRVIAPFSHEIKEEPPDCLNHNEEKPIFHATIFNDIGSDFHDSQDIANGEQLNSVALTDSREAHPVLASSSAENDGILATETQMWIESRPKAGPRSKRNKKKDGNKDDDLAPVVKLPRLKKLSEPLVELKNITSRFPQLLEGGTIRVSDIEIEHEPQVSNESINDDGTRDDINNYESDPDGDNYDDYDYNMTLEPCEPLNEADTAKVGTLSADVKPLVQESISTSASINTPSSKQTQPIKQKKKANEPPTRTRYDTRRSNHGELSPGLIQIVASPKKRSRVRLPLTEEEKKRKNLLRRVTTRKEKDYEWMPRSVIKEKKRRQKFNALKREGQIEMDEKFDNQDTNGISDDEEEELDLLYSESEESDDDNDPEELVVETKPSSLHQEMRLLKCTRADHINVGKKVFCLYCSQGFTSKSSWEEHIAKSHPESGIELLHQDNMICDTCKSKFKTKYKYLYHKLSCTPETYRMAHYCKVCDKTVASLSGHVKMKHGEKKKRCRVSSCKMMFALQSSLNQHMKTVHAETDDLTVCEICGLSYTKYSSQSSHHEELLPDLIEDVATPKKRFKKTITEENKKKRRKRLLKINRFSGAGLFCVYCPDRFIDRATRDEHIAEVHPESGIEFLNKESLKCEICGAMYKTKYKYLYHKLSCTPDTYKKAHFCSLCNKTFVNLTVHVKTVHDVKTMQCKKAMCRSMFASKGALNEHMRTVHNENPIICEICGSDFKAVSAYRGHMLRSHAKEEDLKYVCTVCGSRTIVHERKNPSVCKLCGLVCSNTANRQKHWVRIHKTKRVENPDDLSDMKTKPFVYAKETTIIDRDDHRIFIDINNPYIHAIDPPRNALKFNQPYVGIKKDLDEPSSVITVPTIKSSAINNGAVAGLQPTTNTGAGN
ncbi:unnamed protein product [Owenia fusiformis]|uniref:Uncharacterized protein n=1 Tax=Owenia fusiformis TaxID=6347 RepID=A0A8J1U5B7_OWEFU|nr:unnamed protein product [Owenia fusiformis]